MNGAHIHLLLNHIPILGSCFAFLLLLYGIFSKSQHVIKAALYTMLLSALIGIPAYLSGEDAEEILVPVIGVNKVAIELHKERAETAFWFILVSGGVTVASLVAGNKTKNISRPVVLINLVMFFIVVIFMARTGFSGAEIRHSEIHFEVKPDLKL